MKHEHYNPDGENINSTNNLLDNLSLEISREYGIDAEKTRELIQNNAKKGLDELKNDVANILTDSQDNDQKEKLFQRLIGARDIIDRSSKEKINVLKKELEIDNQVYTSENSFDQYLPTHLIHAAKNPQKPHEHILGLTLGTAESMYSTSKALYYVGKGIIQSPYHIYLAFTGQGKIESFKNM